MKRMTVALAVALCLLLAGCSWLDGSYVSVTPHRVQTSTDRNESLSASDYSQLQEVMEDLVSSGTETAVINIFDYDIPTLEQNLSTLCHHIQKVYPIGAYAVENISCEVGTNGGKAAVAVKIQYRHSRIELRKIQSIARMEDAVGLVEKALRNYESVLTLKVDQYAYLDFATLVQDYARQHPEIVMEVPKVTSEIYGRGLVRVVEITFTYQNSRETLKNMQQQVQPVFDSAVLYVRGEAADEQKFSQLFSFLMERFDYTLETSTTPAYSLLRHGVGDSRAFAEVYAAMCRKAGLECMTVTGTRNAQPWTWNIILSDGVYYHVDLMRCSLQGEFRPMADHEMHGYVWDYSAYPVCEPGEAEPEPAE